MYAKRLRPICLFVLLLPLVNSYPQFRIPELPTFPPSPEILNSKNVQSTNTDINSFDQTVKEVEAMIRANPELPRLTRGEILDLVENITKTDALKQTNAPSVLSKDSRKAKEKDLESKPVMLVKPYTPENGEIYNMEELFTKPPVTQIVGPLAQTYVIDNMINTNDVSPSFNPIRRPTTNREQFHRKTTSTTTTTTLAPVTAPSTTSSSISPSVSHRLTNRRRRPITTTSTATATTTTSVPEPVYSSSSRRPLRRRTTTVKYSNHRYPGDPTPEVTLPPLPSEGLRVIQPPKFNPLAINQDLLSSDTQNKEVFIPQYEGKPATDDTQNNNSNVVSKSSTVSSIDVDIPDDLKDVMSSMNLDSLIEAKPSKSHTHLKKEQYKLEDMLAAFGRFPPAKTTTTTRMPDISNVADTLSPDMRDLLMSFGLIPNTQKSPPKPVSDSLVLENYNAEIPETNPEAYLGFKPLPNDDASRDEMRELLARFGLGTDARQQKALWKKPDHKAQGSENHPVLSFDMIPEEYRDIIDDLGLRTGKMIRAEALTRTQAKQHVFSPEDSQPTNEDELKKIQKLLDFMKKLEQFNGTVTEEDLKKIGKDELKDIVATLNEYNKVTTLDEQNAPNPLNFEDGLDKNEVKRQESSSTTAKAATEVSSTEATVKDSSTDATSDVSSTTSADEGEVKGPSLEDLEDSFGGKTDPPPTTASPPETTTPLRKTGFYYLVDWNSFFDIDDQKGKRVNLRFQPTIGDPKRFLSVTVP